MVAILPSWMRRLSAPKARPRVSLQNSGSPAIGRYSCGGGQGHGSVRQGGMVTLGEGPGMCV